VTSQVLTEAGTLPTLNELRELAEGYDLVQVNPEEVLRHRVEVGLERVFIRAPDATGLRYALYRCAGLDLPIGVLAPRDPDLTQTGPLTVATLSFEETLSWLVGDTSLPPGPLATPVDGLT